MQTKSQHLLHSRNWKLKHKKEIKEYRKKYYSSHKNEEKDSHQCWRRKFPEKANSQTKKFPLKYMARSKVNCAIALGKLIREVCVICKNLKSEAHHSNYNEPLRIIWLCPFHHNQLHKDMAEDIKTDDTPVEEPNEESPKEESEESGEPEE